MFTNIARKSVIYVMTTVFITLVFVVFSILNLSKSVVNVDYTQKIVRFSKQEAVNCASRLELIKTNMNYIITELDITDLLLSTKTNAEIHQQIQKKINYSPYIKDFFIYNEKNVAYYFHTKENAPEITYYFDKKLDEKAQNGIWLPLAASDQNRGNNLYYIKNLKNGLHTVLLIDNEEIFSAFGNTVPFLEKENIFIFSDNQVCLFSGKTLPDKIIDNAFKGNYTDLTFDEGKIMFSREIRETGLKVCTIAKSDYIEATPAFLTKIFFIILIISMCICFFMINKFAKEVNNALDEMHNKFSHYFG